jgi:hypothetical protein
LTTLFHLFHSDFNAISKRALEAYECLLDKKKKTQLQIPPPTDFPLSPIQSSENVVPSFSAVSPRGPQKNPETKTLDLLIHDFESNFGGLYNSATQIMSSSGLFSNPTDPKSLLYPSSDKTMNRKMESSVGDKSLFHSLRRSGELSTNLENVDVAPDVSFILERYSDRLVTLVAEKMLAQSNGKNT